MVECNSNSAEFRDFGTLCVEIFNFGCKLKGNLRNKIRIGLLGTIHKSVPTLNKAECQCGIQYCPPIIWVNRFDSLINFQLTGWVQCLLWHSPWQLNSLKLTNVIDHLICIYSRLYLTTWRLETCCFCWVGEYIIQVAQPIGNGYFITMATQFPSIADVVSKYPTQFEDHLIAWIEHYCQYPLQHYISSQPTWAEHSTFVEYQSSM
jgi:hypothetical protein